MMKMTMIYKSKTKKHNIIIGRVMSSHIGPMYIEAPNICLSGDIFVSNL